MSIKQGLDCNAIMYTCEVSMYVHVCIYCIALDYGQSHINAGSCLVAGIKHIVTKLNI